MQVTTMEKLVATVQELSLARDMETVMRIVRSAARQLTGADGASFVLMDREFCFYADEDAVGPLWKGQRFPLKACISGFAMLNRQQVVIEDIYEDSRIPIDAYSPTFVKSLAMVPIRTMDPIGAIGNYWGSKHLATTEEVTILQSLADITAVTIENVNVYKELEQRVKDRTQELEIANRELEAFSYTVSHDLRAPLRRINSYLDILTEEYADKFDEEGKRITGRILENSKNMGRLIDDILGFSKMGNMELEKTPVSMKDMVADICETALEADKDRDIEFKLKSLSDVQAEPSLIKQVWVNLISNAVKYSSLKEKAIVEIDSEDLGDHVVYQVKDNGAGFDMAYYPKLFGAFQRLHSHEFEGSGIGLATVKKIIAKHQGKIWAEGKVNEGATFFFSLPE